jgi:hypothetical protein
VYPFDYDFPIVWDFAEYSRGPEVLERGGRAGAEG